MSERDHGAIAVFDGRSYLGRIAEARPSRFEAIKPNGETLGLFNSAPAACNALIEASGKEQTADGATGSR